MHPVIDSITARRGKQPPFGDDRRISLVLCGGMMLGVRGAGALKALSDLGLARAFDSVYTTSSGFLNGSYFLAGQISEALEIYPAVASGGKFLNWMRFWKMAGAAPLDALARKRLPLDVSKIHDNPARLYAMMINADKARREYLEVHEYPQEEFPNILRASSSLPFLGGGATRIGGARYHGIPRNSALSDLVNNVLATDATDILVLYNHSRQQEYVRENTGLTKQNRRVFEFCPCPEPMSRFENRPDRLRKSGELARGRVGVLFAPGRAVGI